MQRQFSRRLLRSIGYRSLVLAGTLLIGLTGCDDGRSLSGEKSITGFSVAFHGANAGDQQYDVSSEAASPNGEVRIDEQSRTIWVSLVGARDPDLSWIVPSITLSGGATVEPPSGEAQNFDQEPTQIYTVTAENGTFQNYRVVVKIDSNAALKEVKFGDSKTELTDAHHFSGAVTLWVPADTNLSKLALELTPSSELATVFPASGTSVDFSAGPQLYTVTAQDGSSKDYYVTVITETESTMPIELAGIAKRTATLYVTSPTGNPVTIDKGGTINLSLSAYATPGNPYSREAVVTLIPDTNSPDEQWRVREWIIDGSSIGTDDINIITLKAGNYLIGRHTVTFKLEINGALYSEMFYFVVDK